ncbi:hypothetical protein EJ05DRAFT_185377 [Pseudovirgaria hyperparasitica]|uniref:Uncharacterized protein n=1 Tax=Pseudovirgaria hyperparasitica TaxID=470096 RepID=A0A6A6WI66_9PEZI|nr:uncharacterized protein EJ05DRAFT_185377 [Pseudovirgaria hyperparasitica]KAF2761795.1 hypothetical protein EJ05DRAFT_185377 [Pseudovirgaria hyperparasitica]
MPITELATLTLAPTISPNNPTLKSHLRRAKHAMQSYTSHPFYYYTSPPSPPSPHPHAPQQPTPKIYILGQWASLAQHTSGFIPSAQNQELLSLLGDYMAVESLVHIDVPSAVLPLGGDGLGVVRMRVGGEERCRERVVARLGRREDVGVGAEGKVGFGWTVEDGAELVVVSSWATGGSSTMDITWRVVFGSRSILNVR